MQQGATSQEAPHILRLLPFGENRRFVLAVVEQDDVEAVAAVVQGFEGHGEQIGLPQFQPHGGLGLGARGGSICGFFPEGLRSGPTPPSIVPLRRAPTGRLLSGETLRRLVRRSCVSVERRKRNLTRGRYSISCHGFLDPTKDPTPGPTTPQAVCLITYRIHKAISPPQFRFALPLRSDPLDTLFDMVNA